LSLAAYGRLRRPNQRMEPMALRATARRHPVSPQINFPERIERRVDVEKVFSARGLVAALPPEERRLVRAGRRAESDRACAAAREEHHEEGKAALLEFVASGRYLIRA